MKRTKIVCTIGPASSEVEMLKAMIDAGMDVARVNMSHGSHETHAEVIRNVREAAGATRKSVAILADLQGPKLRIGTMPEEGITVEDGETVTLTIDEITGHRVEGGETGAVIPVQYKKLPGDVKPGEHILLNDGLLEFEVLRISGGEIRCKVITGGVLTSNKGLNLPGTQLSISPITEKDKRDLNFAIEQGADWIALSFVRRANEVHQLHALIQVMTPAEQIPARVIAKIEKPDALNAIEEIIQASDGVMVARGDLGIEIPPETVPLEQKRLIRLCNKVGKPVITATQMLESMVNNPRPTRAEASDVANAILDGTDAIMLSAETSVGQYPLEAVKTMYRIACKVEQATLTGEWQPPSHVVLGSAADVTDAVSHATCETAHDLNAEAIISATASGMTARSVSKYRPHAPVIAVTPDHRVQRQLMLTWGVVPLIGHRGDQTDDVIADAMGQSIYAGMIEKGQRVVITAGVANNMPGTTNLMRVEIAHLAEDIVPCED